MLPKSCRKASVNIYPVAGALGAEVQGVDLGQVLSNQQRSELYSAFLKHHVLFFRDQTLEPLAQRRAAENFGEPDIYPFIKGMPEVPEVIEIIKTPSDERNFGGSWHSDTAYLPRPARGTMLYAVEVPPSGGDTLFANTNKAYESLSDGMRDLLDNMVGVNNSDLGYGGSRAKVLTKLDSMGEQYDAESATYESEHPIVRTHPESGKKGLYVSRSHTSHFKGMTRQESLPFIAFLCDQITHPEHTCRFRWQPGSVAVWDNRITQHYALNDYPGQKRHMRRVTLKGDTPM